MSMLKSYTDQQLYAQLRRHDQQAYGEIVRRHWARLFLRIRMVIPNDELSAAIVQETFGHLWVNAGISKTDLSLSSLIDEISDPLVDQKRSGYLAGNYSSWIEKLSNRSYEYWYRRIMEDLPVTHDRPSRWSRAIVMTASCLGILIVLLLLTFINIYSYSLPHLFRESGILPVIFKPLDHILHTLL